MSNLSPETMRQFKARIEFAAGTFHAIDVYFTAEDILSAGGYLMTYFGPLGIDNSHVKKLIDITPEPSKEDNRPTPLKNEAQRGWRR